MLSLNLLSFMSEPQAAPAQEASPLSGIVTILVAVIVGFFALKILKHTAKTVFVIAVVIAGVLLLTGIIDFAMIKSAGYTIWDWLLKTDLYQEITNKIGR